MTRDFTKSIFILSLSVGISLLLDSCDFRIIKRPGPQYTSEIKWSKEFDVFFCSYMPVSSSIEKHTKYKLGQVFAEYQYSHDGGLFSGFDIDKNSMQLIVTDSLKNTCVNGSCSFQVNGFQMYSPIVHYRNIEKNDLIDTLQISLQFIDFETGEKKSDKLTYIKDK